MAGWIAPALGYVVLVGITGITTKVALRTIEWQQIVYWVPVAYAVLSVILWLVYHKPMVLGTGGGGYGDAHERERDRVERDVFEGFITAAQAGAVYGWNG